MKHTLSVNDLALEILEKLLEKPDFYGLKIEKTKDGTTIVDAGIEAKGGFLAGKYVTEICMGGCGRAEISCRKYGDLEFPSILVHSDHPIIATLGSQYAGWQISDGDYFAIGSGPARALALKPKEIYEEIGYRDDSDKTIVVLETDKPPPEKLIERFAIDSGVAPANLAVILTPTTSLVGAIQVSGRIVETGIHKLRKLGLDPNVISHAWGCAPIAPIHPKFKVAMARTNDAILYGGMTYYVVESENEDKLMEILEKAPSKASEDYGRPFIEIFKEANYDFYKIDPNLFAPAMLIVNNVRSGKVYKVGSIDERVLAGSFGLAIEV